jgi:hypothetical protein
LAPAIFEITVQVAGWRYASVVDKHVGASQIILGPFDDSFDVFFFSYVRLYWEKLSPRPFFFKGIGQILKTKSIKSIYISPISKIVK